MQIQITHEAYLKMRYFVEECDTEISGLGKVRPVTVNHYAAVNTNRFAFGFKSDDRPTEFEQVAEKGLEIYDIEILQQEVSGTHATMNEQILAKFLTDKMRKHERVEDYKVWWHSHVNMEAFFSGTDTGTIEKSTEFPYLISIVTNKPGDIKARFDVFKPQTFSADIKITILPPTQDKKILNWVRSEIRKKVSTRHIPLRKRKGGKPLDVGVSYVEDKLTESMIKPYRAGILEEENIDPDKIDDGETPFLSEEQKEERRLERNRERSFGW